MLEENLIYHPQLRGHLEPSGIIIKTQACYELKAVGALSTVKLTELGQFVE